VKKKYVPQIYNIRVHRIDGSRKLFLGELGRVPPVGAVKEIRTGMGQPLIAKIVARPQSQDEPVEAAEIEVL